MAQLKLILEALIALPKLVAELRDAVTLIQNVQIQRELEQKKAELNRLATQLIGATNNEERRRIVRDLNSLEL